MNEMKEGIDIMKEVKSGVYTIGEEKIDFNYYVDLSYANKLRFVDSVVGLLFSDGNYNSIIRNPIFDFFIIDIFTDIDTSELRNSESFINDLEKFLEDTDIVDIVKNNVKDGIIEELNNAIDDSIEYIKVAHKNKLNDALTNILDTINEKISKIDLDEMMEFISKFSGISESITAEDIVKAYTSTDEFKDNLKELEEVKNSKAIKKNENLS